MKISEARQVLRIAAANAGDSAQYADAALDQTVLTIGDELARECDVTEIVTTITLSEGDEDLPAIHADFRRERLRGEPYLVGDNVGADPSGQGGPGVRGLDVASGGGKITLEVWDIAELDEQAALYPGQTGQPVALAFETPGGGAGAGRCFPIPDDDYDAKLRWVPPFTRWTKGIPILLVTLAGTNNHIASVAVVSGGSGLLTAPAVTLANAGSGSGGTLTMTVAGGRATGVNVTAAGSGYSVGTTALVTGNDASDQTLNIPADYLEFALQTGGCAMLQFSDLKRRFGSSSWQRYQDFLADLRGKTQAPRRRKLKPRASWNWGR